MDTLRTIERYNRFDIEFYEFAKQIFEENFREEEICEKELRIFRLINRIYGAVYGLMTTRLRWQVRSLLEHLKHAVWLT